MYKSVRAKLSGDECDCFSHRARRLLKSHAGKWKQVKQRFWRRMRVKLRSEGI